jgi:hypothetical protein
MGAFLEAVGDEIVTVALRRVGLPQDGQNFLVWSLHILIFYLISILATRLREKKELTCSKHGISERNFVLFEFSFHRR